MRGKTLAPKVSISLPGRRLSGGCLGVYDPYPVPQADLESSGGHGVHLELSLG